MITVIFLGNALHGDDGFAAAVHHRLAGRRWPVDVILVDAVAGGVLDATRGCNRAILVSCLGPRFGQPGQILRLAGSAYPPDPLGDLGCGLGALLAAMRRLGHTADTEIVGVVGARQVPFSAGLSPLVAAAVETTAAMLWRELGGAGRDGTPCN